MPTQVERDSTIAVSAKLSHGSVPRVSGLAPTVGKQDRRLAVSPDDTGGEPISINAY